MVEIMSAGTLIRGNTADADKLLLSYQYTVLGLKRVLILLPGYPTFITRRVPEYLLQ